MLERRPVWLLDVDGVLNAPHPEWGDQPLTGIVVAEGARQKSRWSPALLAEVRDIRDSGLVEIRWASSWCRDISGLEALLDLTGLPLAFQGDNAGSRWDKYFAAESVLRMERRPLVWTDDDLHWIIEGAAGSRGMPEDGPDRLLIQPEADRGLTPQDIEVIWSFIRRCG